MVISFHLPLDRDKANSRVLSVAVSLHCQVVCYPLLTLETKGSGPETIIGWQFFCQETQIMPISPNVSCGTTIVLHGTMVN